MNKVLNSKEKLKEKINIVKNKINFTRGKNNYNKNWINKRPL